MMLDSLPCLLVGEAHAEPLKIELCLDEYWQVMTVAREEMVQAEFYNSSGFDTFSLVPSHSEVSCPLV